MSGWMDRFRASDEKKEAVVSEALLEQFEKNPQDFAQPTPEHFEIRGKTRVELEAEKFRTEVVESVRLVLKEEIESLRAERKKLEEVINELWGRTP